MEQFNGCYACKLDGRKGFCGAMKGEAMKRDKCLMQARFMNEAEALRFVA